jgi:prepilin-type N-terminal cleavage/methylation domain-containing protein
MTSSISPRGYTLLELMVVLAIMGIIMGMATPRLIKMYDTVQFSLEKDDILFQLSGISFSVYSNGVAVNLQEAIAPGEKQIVVLPNGWSISPKASEITYSIYGFCNGGEAELSRGSKKMLIVFSPPLCRPSLSGSQ